MKGISLEVLGDFIRKHAFRNFEDLVADSDMESPTARFYKVREPDQPEAVVKVFSTTDAEHFYWQELTALHTLRRTGRVAPVISDATRDHPDFWLKNFKQPFFIAKPYYAQTLDDILGTATPIEKLDLAAQRVDIARSFWEAGWRDYDWHPSNDVVDTDGRVLRIDLDSALSKRPLPIKSRLREPDYFSRAERDALGVLIAERERTFESSEPLEVSNMVIRLCSFFFDLNDQTELAKQLGALQPPEPAENAFPGAAPPVDLAAHGIRAADHAGNRIDSLIKRGLAFFLSSGDKKGPRPADNSRPPRPAPPIEPWLQLWRSRFPTGVPESAASAPPPPFWQLTCAEWELLARIFYHLIAVQDHGFSLSDLYASLLILEAAVLRDRRRQAHVAKRPEAASTTQLAPTVKFYELLRVIAEEQAIKVRADKQAAAQAEISSSGKAPSSDLLKTSIVSGGNAWPAAGKEGCEDGVLVVPGSSNWFLLVTDGGSDASGRAAAGIVVAEFGAWCQDRILESPEEAVRELRAMLSKINAKLFEASKTSGCTHQAMAVAAVVGVRDRDCFIAYAQAGDSQCMILEPDGSIRRWTRNLDTAGLGQYDPLPEGGIGAAFSVLDAEAAGRGKYRVRLYSDGVGADGVARIRAVPDIEALVQEAAGWGENLNMSVGRDDWTVAGFDIQVERAEPQPDVVQPVKEKSVPKYVVENGADEARLKQALDKVVSNSFKLSPKCIAFWQQALVDVRDSVWSVKLLREWFRVEAPEPLPSPAKETTPPGFSSDSLLDRTTQVTPGERPSKVRESALIIAMVVVGFISAFLFYRFTSSTEGVPPRSGPTETMPQVSSEEQTPSPELVSEESKRIYEILRAGKPYPLERLPGKESISIPEIQIFLRELSVVLKRTGYLVLIEVYGDRSGSAKGNLQVTGQRAQAISHSLVTDFQVPANQVKVEGRGLMDKANTALLKSELDRPVDNSGAVIVVRRRY